MIEDNEAPLLTGTSLLLDLPIDIIQIILQYLDVASFLRLTSTCTALHSAEFANDSRFWAGQVRSTFRVPNQPVVQNHGRRWRALYKRLHTQSRSYTWGDNKCANLGHFDVDAFARLHAHGPGPRYPVVRKRRAGWPGLVKGLEDIGTIADLQCGGWCTTVFSAKGAVYVFGVLNRDDRTQANAHDGQPPRVLFYPPGYVHPAERHDSSTALSQVSTGRSHVLGLADDGRIWSWYDVGRPGVHVKLVFGDTNGGDRGQAAHGHVRKVIAGWGKSTALIDGIGIAVWDPIERQPGLDMEDTALILNSVVMTAAAAGAGDICNFVVLEHSIIFNTDQGKVFFSRIVWTDEEHTLSEPIELTVNESETTEDFFATDVQGSFRNFAVFYRSGAVLTSHEGRMGTSSPFTRIPALQYKNVISLAFGDYHFLALHSTGRITSYGREPQRSGGLGLGEMHEGALRGIRAQHAVDGDLLRHGYVSGRQVWFEPEKQKWIQFLAQGGADPDEARARMDMVFRNPDGLHQGELSDWIEQEGSGWEERYGVNDGVQEDAREDDGGDGERRAYFALSVAAAGWHSGALVLVDPARAQRLSEAVQVKPGKAPMVSSTPSEEGSFFPRILAAILLWIKWFLGLSLLETAPNPAATTSAPEGEHYVWSGQHFPRLQFSDGVEMPGSIPFSTWRLGRPPAES